MKGFIRGGAEDSSNVGADEKKTQESKGMPRIRSTGSNRNIYSMAYKTLDCTTGKVNQCVLCMGVNIPRILNIILKCMNVFVFLKAVCTTENKSCNISWTNETVIYLFILNFVIQWTAVVKRKRKYDLHIH